MKIMLDRQRCQGHGRCYMLAPEVFDADELGHCVVVVDEVVPEEEPCARLGVENCPEQALIMVD